MELANRCAFFLMNAYGQVLRADKINEIANSEGICVFLPRGDGAFAGIIDAVTFGLNAEAIEVEGLFRGFRLANVMIRLNLCVYGAVSAESGRNDVLARAIRSAARQIFTCLIYRFDGLSDAFYYDGELIANRRDRTLDFLARRANDRIAIASACIAIIDR